MSDLVKCPICRKTWRCKKGEYQLPSGPYIPRPTKLGLCTCPTCEEEPVPKHMPPNGAGYLEDDNPWQQNAVRAMEQ